MKRILLIILTIIVLAAAVSYFLLRPETPPASQPKNPAVTEIPVATPETPTQVALVEPTPPTEPQTSAPSPITVLTTEPVIDYWVNQLDGQIYYVTSQGSVKRADPIAGAETISSSNFDEPINRVVISPHGDAIIIVAGEPRNPVFKIFDIEHRVWRLLPSGTTAAAWNSVGPTATILFLRNTPSVGAGTALATYSLAKGTIKTILSISQVGLDIVWMDADTVYLLQRPTGDVATAVYALSIKNQTIKEVISPRKGLWTVWFPGVAGLSFDEKTGNSLLALSGKIEIPLPKTIAPAKCAVERPYIYCGMSFAGLDASRLPDSYLQRASMSSDNLVMISISEKKTWFTPKVLFAAQSAGVAFDAWHLTKRGDSLYFLNRYDNSVYKFSLKPI